MSQNYKLYPFYKNGNLYPMSYFDLKLWVKNLFLVKFSRTKLQGALEDIHYHGHALLSRYTTNAPTSVLYFPYTIRTIGIIMTAD
jgi:hypothetical protein